MYKPIIKFQVLHNELWHNFSMILLNRTSYITLRMYTFKFNKFNILLPEDLYRDSYRNVFNEMQSLNHCFFLIVFE